MKRKDYRKPMTKVVKLQHTQMLMVSDVRAWRRSYGTAYTLDGTEETWE